MFRRMRRYLLLVVLVALVGGAGYAVVGTRSRLDSDRDRVDRRWTALTPSLTARYDRLKALTGAFEGAGAGDRAVVVDLRSGLREWKAATSGGRADPAEAVAVANRLEGLAARARAVVAGSRRLQGVGAVTEALTGLDGTRPPPADVAAFNSAVKRYEDDRGSGLRAPLAPRLGFDRRDTFQPVTPA